MRITICTWLLGIGLDQLTPSYFRKIYVQTIYVPPKDSCFKHDVSKKHEVTFGKQTLNYNRRAKRQY